MRQEELKKRIAEVQKKLEDKGTSVEDWRKRSDKFKKACQEEAENMVYDLAYRRMGYKQIADYFNVDENFIVDNYVEIIKMAKAAKHLYVSDKQDEILDAGDTKMALWLGKQDMGQMDAPLPNRVFDEKGITWNVNLVQANNGEDDEETEE